MVVVMGELVAATGLEPVKSVRTGDLQSPAIAATLNCLMFNEQCSHPWTRTRLRPLNRRLHKPTVLDGIIYFVFSMLAWVLASKNDESFNDEPLRPAFTLCSVRDI